MGYFGFIYELDTTGFLVDAFVSLVMNFNQGIMLERLVGDLRRALGTARGRRWGAIADEIGRPVRYKEVERDGTLRAARRIAEMIRPTRCRAGASFLSPLSQ